MEKFEPAALEIIKRGLEETATGKAFKKLRLGEWRWIPILLGLV